MNRSKTLREPPVQAPSANPADRGHPDRDHRRAHLPRREPHSQRAPLAQLQPQGVPGGGLQGETHRLLALANHPVADSGQPDGAQDRRARRERAPEGCVFRERDERPTPATLPAERTPNGPSH